MAKKLTQFDVAPFLQEIAEAQNIAVLKAAVEKLPLEQRTREIEFAIYQATERIINQGR
jgi:hypothetical protein